MNSIKVEIDVTAHRVSVGGKAVSLTPKEYEMFRTMASESPKVFEREELFSIVWKRSEFQMIDSRLIDQHIARLRHKLKAGAEVVKTVTNYGYQVVGVEVHGKPETPVGRSSKVKRYLRGDDIVTRVMLEITGPAKGLKDGEYFEISRVSKPKEIAA